ncbi:armadillo-type protein [Mycena sp. CBHHK59/15]|nr:armadillo-type protein [Mycena sp. CBHHK59/15]
MAHPLQAFKAEPLNRAKCRMTALLNKLAVQNFDSISNRMLALANASHSESDGRTLTLIANLLFETAINQQLRSSLYTCVAKKLVDRISSKDAFEEHMTETGLRLWDREMMARRFFGVVQFLGELFKHKLLTERIMHECIKEMLGSENMPFRVEALTVLLESVGLLLDTPKARFHMDIYFHRLRELLLSENTSVRLRFQLEDLVDLRSRNWVKTPRKEHIEVVIPQDPPSLDCDGEDEIPASAQEKIQAIVSEVHLTDALHMLTSLNYEYVPYMVSALALNALRADDDTPARASVFLAAASSQDLLLASAVKQGFMGALVGLDPNFQDITRLHLLLKDAGVNDERGEYIICQAVKQSSSVNFDDWWPWESASSDSGTSEAVHDVAEDLADLPESATERINSDLDLDGISETMSNQDSISQEKFSEMLHRIEDLDRNVELQNAAKAKVTQERDALAAQLTTCLAEIQELSSAKDVMEKTRDAERMRRVEMEDRLKAERTAMQENLRLARSNQLKTEARVQSLEGDLKRCGWGDSA